MRQTVHTANKCNKINLFILKNFFFGHKFFWLRVSEQKCPCWKCCRTEPDNAQMLNNFVDTAFYVF